MKKIVKKAAAIMMTACLVTAIPSPVMAAEEYGSSQILEDPEITLHNLEQRNSVSLDVLWQNTSGSQDFDFGPGSDSMTDAYIEFDYQNDTKIDGIDLIGWWPKDQGLRNISIFYDENGQWVPVTENYDVPWKASAGSNGATAEFSNGEQLRIAFDETVITSKLKLQIHSAYHNWSDKISMKLIAPTRPISESEEALRNALNELKNYASSVLTGDLPGEFPESAVTDLSAAIENAESYLTDPDVTDEEILDIISALNEAKELFEEQQIPFPADIQDCTVTLENLQVVSGKASHLNDRQLATGATLSKSDSEQSAYLTFDFGEKKYTLDHILILAHNPLEEGIRSASVEYFNGETWQTLSNPREFGWEGNNAHMEGRQIDADQTVSASRFRLKIEETYNEAGIFSIQEIWASGDVEIDASSLSGLVEYARELLESVKDQNTREADMVKFKLMSATNEDTLSRADQKKIDYLYTELLAAVNQLDESLKDKISPSTPYDVKVEQVTENSAIISFEPSTDNAAVAGYKIYCGESILADIPAPDAPDARVTAEITGLAAGSDYTLVIKAYDASGNLSEGTSIQLTTAPDENEHPVPGPDEDLPGVEDNDNKPSSQPSDVNPSGTSTQDAEDTKAAQTGDSSDPYRILLIISAAALFTAETVLLRRKYR